MCENLIYYGSKDELPENTLLNAGPISLIYQNGYIRSVRYGKIEFIKRIYMALRDHVWNTIPGIIDSLVINKNANDFSISFTSRHSSQNILFDWIGKISGDKNGTLEFSMKGIANSTFQRNRIGFCTLHPVDLCAGKDCTVTTETGQITKCQFPLFIAPYPPIKEIHSLQYEISNQAQVRIDFYGDIFEMEDQRNWTDNSFKTYSTPSSLPTPVTIEKGSIIEQKIIITLSDHNDVNLNGNDQITIHIPEMVNFTKRVPEIGIGLTNSLPITPMAIEKTDAMGIQHLRYDLYMSSETIITDAEFVANICNQLNASLELALYFTSNIIQEIELLAQILKSSQLRVYRFLIFKDDEPVTSPETLLLALPLLRNYSTLSYIASGTDSYFVELNRKNPASDLCDQVCYSVNPQVHTFDNFAIMENLPGVAETLRTAHLFLDKAEPIITPVTLRPRKNRKKPEKFNGEDTRQKGLFCAAWTSAHLFYCTIGGAASATYFELTGDSGIMDEDGKTVYPVYHVLSTISELANSLAENCTCTNSTKAIAMAFMKGTRLIVLIVNLTDYAQEIKVVNLPSIIHTKLLDETSVFEATNFSEQWKCLKGEAEKIELPYKDFTLLPYAILQIEAAVLV